MITSALHPKIESLVRILRRDPQTLGIIIAMAASILCCANRAREAVGIGHERVCSRVGVDIRLLEIGGVGDGTVIGCVVAVVLQAFVYPAPFAAAELKTVVVVFIGDGTGVAVAVA